MKKILATLLTVIFCLSMVACGSTSDSKGGTSDSTNSTEKTLTKEEMLEQALSVDQYKINNDSVQNAANAKLLYCDAVLLLSGTVLKIEEDHVEMGTLNWKIDVYLPLEELATLRAKQQLTVVGKTDKETKKTEYNYSGNSGTTTHYVMSDAYLVEDKFEITGKITGTNASSNGGFNFKVGNDSYLKVLYFAEGVDRTNAKVNDDGTITVRGVICEDHIYDAIIVG